MRFNHIKLKSLTLLIIALILTGGCLKIEVVEGSLQADINDFDGRIKIHGVIACAANNMLDESEVEVYFYPPAGVSQVKIYLSNTVGDQEWNYNNYSQLNLSEVNLFDGYLKKYVLARNAAERWSIVSFERNDTVFLSDPIRLRHVSQPTEINPALIYVTEDGVNPDFSWDDGRYATNDIYFQVITDTAANFISGTYTRDKFFEFYDLANVVLNINEGHIPELLSGNTYDFILMAVDDDNWVNLVGVSRFQTH